jgi:hypothetical protein
MKFLLLSIALCSAALFARSPQSSAPLVIERADCESIAPLNVEILSSEVSSGIADIVYRITPLLVALKVESSFDLPGGATLLSHMPAAGEDIAANRTLSGRAKVRLPEDAGRITLRSTISFTPTSNANGAANELVERASALRDLTWGDFSDEINLPLVQSGDELSLDMPATRTGSDL